MSLFETTKDSSNQEALNNYLVSIVRSLPTPQVNEFIEAMNGEYAKVVKSDGDYFIGINCDDLQNFRVIAKVKIWRLLVVRDNRTAT